jgi:predicted Zn-dependent protease
MMTPRHLCAGLLLGFAVCQAQPAISQDTAASSSEPEASDEVNYLALAAVLIGDGHYDRARQALASVDLQAEDFDAVRYHTLSGLVALNLNELAIAAEHFQQAVDAGEVASVVWLYLAQAHFGLENYRQTLYALDSAGEQATAIASAYIMRAQANWQLKEYEAAWQTLVDGRAKFPDRASAFARRQVLILVEQGLHQTAADVGQAYLAGAEASPEDAIAIGNALRQAQALDKALALLEPARLRFPNNVTLAKLTAHTYLAKEQTLAAAEVLNTAAIYEPSLTVEAAELYRRAGWLIQALTLNSQIIDQSAKLKQRMAILIQLQRFDMAAAMAGDLQRVGLLGDEDIRYALAYALFKRGEFDAAEGHLAQLTRSDLFRKAAELRSAMQECADSPWLCG